MSDSYVPFEDSVPAEFPSNDVLHELKVRARLRLNALREGDPIVSGYVQRVSKKRRWPIPAEWKLQHALNIVAIENDFVDWNHVRHVLSGSAKSGDDLGGFWYSQSCMLLLNHWFTSYDDAKAFQRQANTRWLFPYARQYVVGDANYVKMLSLDPALSLWNQVDRDLCSSYGSVVWQQLCAARLQATRGLPPSNSGRF